jgi:hypothetical protein
MNDEKRQVYPNFRERNDPRTEENDKESKHLKISFLAISCTLSRFEQSKRLHSEK